MRVIESPKNNHERILDLGCRSRFVSRHVAVVVQDMLQRGWDGWSVLWCVTHVQLLEWNFICYMISSYHRLYSYLTENHSTH